MPEFNLTTPQTQGFGKPAEQYSDVHPPVSQGSYHALDLMVRLRKSPEVKRMLNKDWALDKGVKKGGSIFDDFLAPESDSEEEEKKPAKEQIAVDEGQLMGAAIAGLLAKGHTSVALLLTLEWPSFVAALPAETKLKLANTLVLDTVVRSCRADGTGRGGTDQRESIR